jgi:hypothetical protein
MMIVWGSGGTRSRADSVDGVTNLVFPWIPLPEIPLATSKRNVIF